MQVPTNMSVEHVLPQNPQEDSQWCKDFSEKERAEWTNRLGNLVLISRRKNSSQGRSDFTVKKEKYFRKNVETFPNSLRVIQKPKWDLTILKTHHAEVVSLLSS
jgi:hypothetical protein